MCRAQAVARGGTFVRPGASACGRPGDAPDGAYSSREVAGQILAAANWVADTAPAAIAGGAGRGRSSHDSDTPEHLWR